MKQDVYQEHCKRYVKKDNSERLIAYNKFLLEFLKEKEEEQDDK